MINVTWNSGPEVFEDEYPDGYHWKTRNEAMTITLPQRGYDDKVVAIYRAGTWIRLVADDVLKDEYVHLTRKQNLEFSTD